MPPTGPRKKPASGTRSDRRYKDQEAAPPIVSEKRLTFFLPEETFRILRLHTGYFQVNNARNDESDDPLPETPSALVREAIDMWIDQFRTPKDRSRTDAEWEARMESLRKALKQLGS
ncbi:MAG: hypothetical protein AB7K09_06525 [Planctomycetota bacterium]